MRWGRAIGRFVRNKPLGATGGVLVLLLLLAAALASVLASYDPLQVVGAQRLLPPSAKHLMGTDNYGFDVFTRVLYGARVSLYVATLAVVLSTALATVVGVVTGYWSGLADMVIQRIVDALMAFPWLVLLLSVMFLLGTSMTNLGVALGFIIGIRNSRVVRSAVVAIKENQYFEAAHALGLSQKRIILVYVLPNVVAPIMVIATLSWGFVILVESELSFLGFGVPPPEPSWGRMLSVSGRPYFEEAPWIAVFPGLAISMAVFGFNMLGDALRDVLDPRLRQ
ncbi:MAG: ABC transporter permease [Chloroflexi bacterium]|nr:ABC transporter permease [Chloroflexota bacterium]